MQNSIKNKLQQQSILISDGAWGTLLQEKGLEPGVCPESWNIEFPDRVKEVATAYAKAGSDMIETNSFGGSKFKLDHYGLADKAFELNQLAAQITREAAGDDIIVLGSVGPTGKILMMGDVSEEDLYEAFKEQVMGLEMGGADAICIETMTDLDEARLAVKAAKENTDLEVICTMTFDKTIQGDFKTMMGVTPEQMLETLIPEGVDIIGTNCGNGMENMIPIVEAIRQVNKDIPVLVHANAGLPHLCDGKNVFDETPEITASFIPDLIKAGANLIGGCCGTTPEHIKVIRQAANRGNE
ncbi:MAG: methionine synthase [Bacteroidetes bacterium]|jgi:5-methyltetrahydrofolate--homocysteine methyltransferase|nr:methionine synthase [Bacteroidota bacterium]MBT3748728.1 methionine synthase [Bacteroidota bacterium]MBT4399248.1 methionine synthase [Bacteroidota bacterium]MBT4409968.1 methionine synthase [Bacteroidota bacterium]MBT5425796.1 methionine synthase [Bacteroidota bacterium]